MMQDVTIPAPKQAPVSYTQILSWLSVATALKDVLVAEKVTIPGALADLITKLGQVAAAFQGGLVPPTSIENDLQDILVIGQAVKMATGHQVINAGIDSLISAVTWTQTGIANVKAGQFGVVASGHISIDGAQVPVAAAVFRTDQGAAAIATGFQVGPLSGETVAAADYDALQSQLDTAKEQMTELVAASQAKTDALTAANAQIADLEKQLAAAQAAAQAPTTPPAAGQEPAAQPPQ